MLPWVIWQYSTRRFVLRTVLLVRFCWFDFSYFSFLTFTFILMLLLKGKFNNCDTWLCNQDFILTKRRKLSSSVSKVGWSWWKMMKNCSRDYSTELSRMLMSLMWRIKRWILCKTSTNLYFLMKVWRNSWTCCNVSFHSMGKSSGKLIWYCFDCRRTVGT